MLLNKVHAIFVRRGRKLKKEGLASKKRLAELDLSQFTALEQVELNALRAQALGLTETLAELDNHHSRRRSRPLALTCLAMNA